MSYTKLLTGRLMTVDAGTQSGKGIANGFIASPWVLFI